jgi:hypothetical protein
LAYFDTSNHLKARIYGPHWAKIEDIPLDISSSPAHEETRLSGGFLDKKPLIVYQTETKALIGVILSEDFKRKESSIDLNAHALQGSPHQVFAEKNKTHVFYVNGNKKICYSTCSHDSNQWQGTLSVGSIPKLNYLLTG